MRKLSLWVLDLICEGLGLESRYLREELSQVQLMAINHYPPCPDPSLTLGLPKHSEVNLITFRLQRESHGLQVLKDGQWLAIEPLPNAFVVNVCHMLHVCPFFFFFTFNCPFFQQAHVSYFISWKFGFKCHGGTKCLHSRPTNYSSSKISKNYIFSL